MRDRVLSATGFLGLGVAAAGFLLILAAFGTFGATLVGSAAHYGPLRFLLTALVALPVGGWLSLRANQLRRKGRVAITIIAGCLLVLNIELITVPFALCTFLISVWLLRSYRPNPAFNPDAPSARRLT